MSKAKSFSLLMVFVCVLFLTIVTISPAATFADDETYVTDNIGKAENDEDSKSNSKQTDAGEDNTELASSDIGIFDYIKVLLALGLVIALLVFVLKFINKKNTSYQQNHLMKSLGGVSVGAQKSVQLVQVGNRMYLVGVGENVSLLKEIEAEDEIQNINDFYNQKTQDSSTVPYLTEILSKLRKDKSVEHEQTTSFNDLFSSKLKKIQQERSNELEGWKSKEKDNNE